MTECWKPIDGWRHYDVSDDGRVRSATRLLRGRNSTKRKLAARILKGALTRQGYHFVVLYEDEKRQINLMHRLVAKAFVDNPLGLREVNHIDGNKLNNAASNLQWTTRTGNMRHAWARARGCHDIAGALEVLAFIGPN